MRRLIVAFIPKVIALANPTNWLVLCRAATARGFDGVLPVASMSLFTMPGIQSNTYKVGYAFYGVLASHLKSPNPRFLSRSRKWWAKAVEQ